eukprot:m.30362 g.30362  ORF g.30362 m.30362 type:complete len:396 (-) comp6225_c0_seq1:4227-5414(-)
MSKIKPDEWMATKVRVSTTARNVRDSSSATRSRAGETTRIATTRVQRAQRATENELNLRIDWIEQRVVDLEKVIDDVLEEVDALKVVKIRTEKESADTATPLEINKECQSLRTQRYGVDLVEDAVDEELDSEETLLQETQDLLHRAIKDADEQLRLLRAAKYALEKDVKEKAEALGIDTLCRDLDRAQTTVEMDVEVREVHDNPDILPNDWDSLTSENIQEARECRNTSVSLREEMEALLQESQDRMLKQSNIVEDMFNARIGELKDALNEAETHLEKVQLEIASTERTIDDLEGDIEDKMPTLQVAKDRLTRRSNRPQQELVRDPAHFTLLREVEEISATIQDLRKELKEEKQVLLSLNRTRLELEEDIACKKNSLNVDNKCMKQRQEYKYRSV